MVFSLRSPLKPPLCFLDSLFEGYFGRQLRGPGNHPSHLCRDWRLALFKGETWAEFNIRNCPFRFGSGLISYGDMSLSKEALMGDGLALLGAIAASGYLLVGRKMRKGQVSSLLYLPGLFNGGLLLILFALIFQESFWGYSSPTVLYLVLLALVLS